MKNYFKNKRFLNIFLLISLVGFLVLPNVSFAEEFDDIALRETAKYLELPGSKIEELIHSFINIFHSEWIDLVGSGYVSADKMAVPSIMKKVVQVQALNHLLIDAPIQTTLGIVKNAAKIARVFLIKDISGILGELEKESVEKAVDYGMSVLLENEIRMSPGAIEFEYKLREGGIGKALIQYIMIYKPSDAKRGEMVVRFYSAESLRPPKNEMSYGGMWGVYTELEHDLPPFIVDIRGTVENYQWVGDPSMKIDFPDTVPDLGIKPLGLWEKHLLKPIESTIKDIEVIITKVTGKSPKIVEDIFNISKIAVDIWDEIKSTFSEINPFSPAVVVQTPVVGVGQEVGQAVSEQSEVEPPKVEEEMAEVEPPLIEPEPEPEEKLTLSEIQERLDDIAERIDIINQQMAGLVGTEISSSEKESKKEEEEIQEEEIEETEESEEFQEEEESEQEKSAVTVCQKGGGDYPTRNRVIINEIAWMGTNNSAQDEWIELKNISGAEINLSGWQLLDKDQQIKIIFDNQPRALNNGFFLLERTDDNSVPGITADLIYTGGLSNTNEALYLFDENCQFQDEVIANPNWPAGDNSSKRTMERKSNLSWQTSANPGGTPKKGNSSGYVEIISGGGGGGGGAPPSPSYPKILISEIQISPTEERFIELYNPNNKEVNLTGWYIQRKTETGTSWISSVSSAQFEGKIIQSGSHFLIARSSTLNPDILLDLTLTENNVILLKNPNRETVDKVGFGQAQDFEKAPFPENPETKDLVSDLLNELGGFSGTRESFPFLICHQSLGRKINEQGDYQDTDNNLEDFEIQDPTPKEKNQIFSHYLDIEELFNLCSTEDNCTAVGGYWYNDSCNLEPEATPNICDSEHLDLCINQELCEEAELHWHNSACNLESETIIGDCDTEHLNLCLDETDCLAVDGYWYNEVCNVEPELKEQPSQTVVINEIAWMGTQANSTDEWIELYNNTEEEIDLSGWFLKATDGTPEIELTGIISPNDFYLLERTDDTTVSDIPADQIYTGALGNEGEELELWRKDEEGNLILVDKVSCKKDTEGNCLEWFAGDNLTKQTMERIKLSKSDFDNWANNNLITRNGLDVQNNPINGTPKAENSVSKTSTQISGSLPFNEFNEITLTLLGSPYLIQNTLTVLENTTLTVEPGVALKFKDNAGLEVKGTLKAIGGENKEITFTSLSPPAYWQGIYFSQTSFNSELNWTIVRYGKRSIGEPPAILVDNSSITFRNSILENYTDRGIKLVNSNSLIEKVNFLGGGITISTVGIEIRNGSPTIKNCDLIKNNKHGIFIAFLTGEALPIIEGNNFEENENSIYALNPNVIFKSNRAKNNILNGILIRCYFSQNLTWFLNDIPYVVEGFLEVETGITLLINPGVIVKFKSSAYFKIKGTLLAQGSEEDPIVFTSLRDDYGGDTNNDGIITSPGAGNWGGLTFISGSDNSVLKNVIVSYGGYWHPSWFEQGLVSVMGSKIETDKFTAKYGSEAGLYLLNSTSIIKNSHFENNEIGLRIQGTEIIPQITDYHFENNERRDVYWPNGGENCQNFKELEIECSCCPYG